MANERAAAVSAVHERLVAVLAILIEKRDTPTNSWDAEWWRQLEHLWDREIKKTNTWPRLRLNAYSPS